MVVVLTLRIFPSEVGADLDELKRKVRAALPEGVRIHRFSEEPIAFGLVALVADVVLPEEGDPEVVEKSIRGVEGVSNIQALMVRRA